MHANRGKFDEEDADLGVERDDFANEWYIRV